MNCTQVREHLTDVLDGQTSPELAHHLDACTECAALIYELRKDVSVLAAMPAAPVPPILLARVMSEVHKVSHTRKAWHFFAPRLAPVAAALAVTVLSYNLTPDLWSWQRASQPPQTMSEKSDATLEATTEDKARTFGAPLESEDAGKSMVVLPEPQSPWLMSSLAGGAAFALWSGVVYLWYKKRA